MKDGFTLAEVLITLGIIGVVAAMTLPTLIQNNTEKARVTALKKQYSILNQAYQRIVFDKGTPDIWLKDCENTKDCSEKFANEFKEYLKIVNDCGFTQGCFKDAEVKNFDGSDYFNFDQRNETGGEYKVALNDGTGLMFYADKLGGVNIKIDIDGFKGEHTLGKDIFILNPKSDNKMTLEPNGAEYSEGYQKACLDVGITSGRGKGSQCSAWVIYNGNMDYLHCPDKLKTNNWNNCKGK